jgi:hypothetical protein
MASSQEIDVEGYEGKVDGLAAGVAASADERKDMKEKTTALAKQMLGDGGSEASSGGVAGTDDFMAMFMYVSSAPGLPTRPSAPHSVFPLLPADDQEGCRDLA